MSSHKASPNEILSALPPEAQQHIREWGRAGRDNLVVRRANFHTQLKILLVHVLFAAALAAYLATGGHWAVVVVSVPVLGLAAFPFLRIFMHTQAHWKAGNGPVRNWLLDHGISVLLGLPQTGYKYGHLAHHRYDNDFDGRGFPKDLQSTYIFSRNGRPTNIWLWCAFYIIVYQHAIHLFHVLNAPRRREMAWYALEALLIAGFNVALYSVSARFYLWVYLPALVLGWVISAITLYMMHAVDLDRYQVHPTLNTRNRLFNWIGDNGGYHIEHSLYPNLHPIFLDKVSDLLQPPPEQVLDGDYVTEALRLLVKKQPRAEVPAHRSSGHAGNVQCHR